jgi:hypothetical protein
VKHSRKSKTQKQSKPHQPWNTFARWDVQTVHAA